MKKTNRCIWFRWMLFIFSAFFAYSASAIESSQSKMAQPQDDQRIALVIGNSRYESAPLQNPVNDSKAFAEKLREMGFQVIEKENLTTRQIPATLREFRSSLKPGAVALFFYAGHGLQIKGVNYLPAVDADVASEEDVSMQSIDVNKLLDMLGEAKTRLNLVFLDACRNNPFTRRLRSGISGLAKVDAPSGTLISFATRPGSAASDGTGSNHGLYTEMLLQAIDEPNLPIEQVLKQVGSAVKQASKGQQEPWSEGSIEGDFSFRTAVVDTEKINPAGQVTVSPEAIELTFWNSVRSGGTQRDYQSYLDKYPKGQFVSLAQDRLNSQKTTVAEDKRGTGTGSGKSKRKFVAIAGFENKSTYGADKLWDTSGQLLTTSLLEMGTFRLVEWEKMKQLFDWHALSTNSLVKSPEKREEARKILLTEYFLSGSITQYDVSQKSEVSAFSKKKVYTTSVRVDLQLQDASTGEYISGATGMSTEKQEFDGDFSGGKTGSWDPKSGDQALNNAIQDALKKLVQSYNNKSDLD